MNVKASSDFEIQKGKRRINEENVCHRNLQVSELGDAPHGIKKPLLLLNDCLNLEACADKRVAKMVR